jgi:WD40 repeat protein
LDGKQVAAVRADGEVSLWDLASHKLVRKLPDKARAALFTSSGLLLRLPDGALLLDGRRFARLDGRVQDWAAVGDKLFVLVNGTLRLFDLVHGTEFPGPAPAATAIAVHGSSGMVAAGAAGRIDLLDWTTLQKRGSLKIEGAEPVSIAFSPDGKLLAASGQDGAVHLYELPGGGEVAHLPVAGATSVSGLQFSPDGTLLRLLAEGSTSVEGGVRFLRIGDPSSLPEPAEGLRRVLDDHGVVLEGGEIEPRPPPISVPAPPR